MHRWYLIQSKASSEPNAVLNLQRQGFETYFPRLLQIVRFRGRWQERINALFPRYLFLRLEEGYQSLAPVRSTVGISRVVRFGADYAVVPDAVIAELKGRACPDTGLHRLAGQTPLVAGAAVRILTGAFSGLEGIFQRQAGAERVVVLLTVLGRETPVRIPGHIVSPAAMTWGGGDAQ